MKQRSFPEMQICSKVESIPEALSIYMNNLVYALKRSDERIVTLSLGEAYFDIPMFNFRAIDFEKGYHYSESMGLPELREKIAVYYTEKYDAPVDAKTELLISAGSKPLIFMAMRAVLNDGDEVLIPEPAWLSYPEEAKIADAVPKFISYDCEVKDYHKYFTRKTKMLILNNPNNPAGRVYSNEELSLLYSQCRQKGIYILVDEAYSDFLVEEKFTSMVNVVPDKDGIIVVNSLSKNLGISGWRVGYVISNARVIYNILKLNQHLITCASTILLQYLAKYFDEMIEVTLPQAQEVVLKRHRIEEFIKKIGLETLSGSATFYFFVGIGSYSRTSLELALYLLFKHHIAVVPGSAYGKSTGRFIRIGVGVEPENILQEVLVTIKQVIDEDEYKEELVTSELNKLGLSRFQP